MDLRLWHYDLPLRHTFTISRESIDVQPTVIVELEQDGVRGYGEATTNQYYGVTLESLCAAIGGCRGVIESQEMSDPVKFYDSLAGELDQHRFALCALDQAAYDLWGKLQGKPVYELWELDTGHVPPSNYTIGIDEIDTMVAKMNEFAGWPVYKIKLGTDRDVEIVTRLREETDAVFRVDANCGWTADETLDNSQKLKRLGVEFIEQPMPPIEWEAMRRLRNQSVLPIVADESCQREEDVACCDGFFHGINIKLVKCGGLTPARRMIEAARLRGLSVMVGCMTESSVGISAIAQLLPLLDAVDMDGAVLLAEDIATGVRLERGVCHYPDRPGCGVELIQEGRRLL